MWRKRIFLILPGLELRPLGRPSRSQSLYRLRYRDSFTVVEITKLCFPIAILPVIQNTTIPQLLFRATAYISQNVFTFTLHTLEGRTAVAWEPSTKIMLLLSHTTKRLSLIPWLSLSRIILLFFLIPLSVSGLQRVKTAGTLIYFSMLYSTRPYHTAVTTCGFANHQLSKLVVHSWWW
jgi:hypothetical protein